MQLIFNITVLQYYLVYKYVHVFVLTCSHHYTGPSMVGLKPYFAGGKTKPKRYVTLSQIWKIHNPSASVLHENQETI